MWGSDKTARIRVVIYCRISLDRHGDQVKVERQEEDCRRLCERLGWDVEAVFVDNSRSAWHRNRKRPGWDAMLEGVQAGLYDAIVVYHGDRLIRQPWDLEVLLRVADEKRLRLASPTGTRNLDSADDRFVLRIEAAQACRESDNISRRTKRGHDARVAAGIPTKGGTRAFGYERDMTLCMPEARAIREVAARILAGEPISALLKELNAREIRTPTGAAWQYSSLHKMLTRPKLAALVTRNGAIAGPGAWDPVLDRETWEALQLALSVKRSTNPGGGSQARRHLLSNIAVCGYCGKGLAVRHHRTASLMHYRCINPDCDSRVGRNAAHLDEFVIGFVLERLADPRVWGAVEDSLRDTTAAVELAALEERRREAVMQFADDDTMDAASLRQILARMDERIAAARARIAASSARTVLVGCRDMPRADWDALPLGRRRAIIRELAEIRVFRSRRGAGFDALSVSVRPPGEGPG